jgi:hypothetical protein
MGRSDRLVAVKYTGPETPGHSFGRDWMAGAEPLDFASLGLSTSIPLTIRSSRCSVNAIEKRTGNLLPVYFLLKHGQLVMNGPQPAISSVPFFSGTVLLPIHSIRFVHTPV